ncbi:unnamed protein product [Chironomus riparius]|uniref:PDZ domain-containing protein n=1 Tax=Chironomus riparius TaxID=315576 RepID=A0A9N9RVS3_9DIPT|nr:unnamed protein product [Chironomus riparius]
MQEIVEKSSEKLTVDKNKQIMMSFVDKLWSMEISGGFESSPLVVIGVKKNGLAKRAGIKVGDIISHINNIPTNKMTLNDAQLEIQESGKSLKLTVKSTLDETTSSSNDEDETPNTVDFWFKPIKPEDLDLLKWKRKRDEKRRTTKLLYQDFPWNDRQKVPLRASNCFKVNEKKQEREIKLKASKERFNECKKEIQS